MSTLHTVPLHIIPPSGNGSIGEYFGSNGDGTSSWSIPPGISFNLQNVIYVASNGSDINSGTNQNKPVQTPQKAIDLIDATLSHSGLIQFLDSATYMGQLNIPGRGFIYFNGASASLEFDDPTLSLINIPDTGINNITVFNMSGINNYGGGKILDLKGEISNCFMFSLINQGGIYTEGGFIGKMVALVASTLEVAAGSQCSLAVVNDILVNATINGDFYISSPICNTSTFTVNTGGRFFVDIQNPQSSSVVNSGGTIQGNFGNIIYGNKSFEGTITTQSILLDVTSGSPNAGDVMTYNGSSAINLQPLPTPDTWPALYIPWNTFLGPTGSFQAAGDAGTAYYVPWTQRSGGTPVSPTSSMDWGTITFSVETAGTYNFTFEHNLSNDGGILTLDIDNGADIVNIDMYASGGSQVTASWTEILDAGTHTIHAYCNTKNPSSINFWILPATNIGITRIS